MNIPSPSLFFILSLPRSGSTVLTAELDRFEEIVCLPESYFPFIISLLTEKPISRQCWANLFLAGCDAGFLLDVGELRALIEPDDWRKTFVEIGLACARKTGRDPAGIRAIVWKSTRALSGISVPLSCDARFILLRRNLVNVFESQFRVDFGIHNRNPVRFAAFRQSYEALFADLPQDKVFTLEYETIPNEIPHLLSWMGAKNSIRSSGTSTMAATVVQCEWHKGLLDGFQSKDPEKRKNIGMFQRLVLHSASGVFRFFRRYFHVVRKRNDQCLANRLLNSAKR